MRISIIACLLLNCITLNFAQVPKFNRNDISIQNQKEIDLGTILRTLTKKEGLLLSCESGLLKDKFSFTNLDQLPFTEALNIILNDANLEYKIIDNSQILIRKKSIPIDNWQLYGQIKDRKTHEPLSFCSIYLLGTTIGSYADSLGRFNICIPKNYKTKSDTIAIQRVGYKTRKLALKDFIDNIDIRLDINSRMMSYVTILAKSKVKPILNNGSSIRINNQAYTSHSIGNNDILRKLQMLPSVSANNDNSAKAQIRGSATYETMVFIDGLRIYNPTHFYDVFSAINNDYVKTIDFYKNNIPIDTRSMTGGVVKLKSNNIMPTSTSATIDVNMMDVSGVITMPITNNIGINISGRRSIFEKTRQSFFGEIISANQFNLKDDNLINFKNKRNSQQFDYYDLNSKLIWNIDMNNHFELNIYYSKDNYLKTYNNTIKRKQSGDNLKIDFRFKDQSRWNNTGIGLKYIVNWNSKLNTKISYSKVKYDQGAHLHLDIATTPLIPDKGRVLDNRQTSTITDNEFKIDNTYQLNKKTSIKMGFDITNYQVNSIININNSSIFDQNMSHSSYLTYGEYNLSWRQLKTKFGLQSSFYSGTKKYYSDPSVSIDYSTSKRLKFYTHINRQHQYIRELIYESPQGNNSNIWTLSDENIPILSSENYSIGSTYTSSKSSMTIEVFYKNKKGLSTLLLTRPGDNIDMKNYRLFFGNGKVYGLEILWNKTYKKYTSQLAYTLSTNNQQYKQIFHNQYHPSPDDTRNQVKWSSNYKHNKLEYGLNIVYSSGLPYFDFSDIPKGKEREKLNYVDVIEYLPDYIRADILLSYHFKINKNSSQLYLSIYNFTNRINITDYRVIRTNINLADTNDLLQSQTNLLSRTINLGFKALLVAE